MDGCMYGWMDSYIKLNTDISYIQVHVVHQCCVTGASDWCVTGVSEWFPRASAFDTSRGSCEVIVTAEENTGFRQRLVRFYLHQHSSISIF